MGTPRSMRRGMIFASVFTATGLIIAGIFGAMTVSKRIFYIQAVPAILGLLVVLIF